MLHQLNTSIEKVSAEQENLRKEFSDLSPESTVDFLFRLLLVYREAVLCSGYPDSQRGDNIDRHLAIDMATRDIKEARRLWDEGAVDDLLPPDVLAAKNKKSVPLEDILKPSHFFDNPTGSVARECEAETVARNIMVIRKRLGDKWDLSLEEYREGRKKDGNWSSLEEGYFEEVYPLISTPIGAAAFAPSWTRAAKKVMDQQLSQNPEAQ